MGLEEALLPGIAMRGSTAATRGRRSRCDSTLQSWLALLAAYPNPSERGRHSGTQG